VAPLIVSSIFGVAAGIPAAMLSRGLAGLAGNVLIVNLAGSSGGVKDGMAVLAPVLARSISLTRTSFPSSPMPS